MARVNNLSNFLTDVASAIKTKKGSETAIPAANFDTEILALPSQGVYQTKVITINENGQTVITPDSGYDAMDGVQVTTNVPEKQLQTKSYNFTTNQTIELSPDTGYDGFDSVVLTINVPVGEDLSAELTEQEEIIARLKTELENKAGKPVKPNIFCQSTEPSKKDGIWLQTDKEFNKIYCDEQVVANESWYPNGTFSNLSADRYNMAAVAVGTDVYIFGGSVSSTVYEKYNVTTGETTVLGTMPYSIASSSSKAVYLDGNIYITSGRDTFLKYNISSDTFTKLTNPPFITSSIRNYCLAAANGNLYVFGYYNSSNSTVYRNAYRYNIASDTYTSITTGSRMVTSSDGPGAAVTIGNNIYIFCDNYATKYDVDNDTYTALANIPFSTSYGPQFAIAYGTNIYLFGDANNDNGKLAYKYNTLTDTWTQLTSNSYMFCQGSVVQVENKVLLIGGYNSKKTVKGMQLVSKIYDNNSVVISQGRIYNVGYGTKLVDMELFETQPIYGFADAWFYTTENGLDYTIPTYYGDGTQWIKFKN